MSVAIRGHERLDRRSLALHRAIAAKLLAHPERMAIARDNLDRWSAAGSRSQPYFDEWRRLLDLPLAELAELLGEESERMTALRQTSPFAGILDPKERWAIYADFEADFGRRSGGARNGEGT